jgi:hypothetical protein
MEIDREQLIRIIEAILETTYEIECELAMYQLIAAAMFQERNLAPEQVRELLDKTRLTTWPKIMAEHQPGHKALLEKVPKLVDRLQSSQEFLRLLREWRPQGPIN